MPSMDERHSNCLYSDKGPYVFDERKEPCSSATTLRSCTIQSEFDAGTDQAVSRMQRNRQAKLLSECLKGRMNTCRAVDAELIANSGQPKKSTAQDLYSISQGAQ